MTDLLADSSFYICFLDNIKSPENLIKILEKFSSSFPPVIFSEVKKSKRSKEIFENKKLNINIFEGEIHISEVLRPFFSIEQKERGEHELIVLAFICYNMKMKFELVIDDKQARNFIKRNLIYLSKNLKDTINFLCDCYSVYGIFKKEEVLDIFNLIENSNYGVKKEIMFEAKKKMRCN
ncbi:MAG: hypothetical protein ABIE55_02520 [Candidatus Aenigmatarchaeota archaeon]